MKRIKALIIMLCTVALTTGCTTTDIAGSVNHEEKAVVSAQKSDVDKPADITDETSKSISEQPQETAAAQNTTTDDSGMKQSEITSQHSLPEASQPEMQTEFVEPSAAEITPDDDPALLEKPAPEPAEATVSSPVVQEQTASPSRPSFDAGTVIGGAAAQVSGFMTRDSGSATGMGWFTFSFSVYDSMDKMIGDLTAVMRQEHDLYGNTWFDLEYLGESGGYHTFKCYRA